MRISNLLTNALFPIIAFLVVSAVVTLAPPAHADWDHAAEAREAAARKKAAAESAKRNAEISAKRADAMRKILAAAPYNENAAKLATLNESELKVLHHKRTLQINEESRASSARGLDDFAKAMSNLSPEQRAMLEKQSGVKIDDVMKQARESTAKK